MDTFVVLLGIGLATAGWLYSNERNRILQRKQTAIKFVHDHNFNLEWVNSTRALFNKFIDEPHFKWETLIEKRYSRHQQLDNKEEELFRCLMCVLNYLEIAAVAVLSGAADEDILRETQRSVFISANKHLTPFIDNLRTITEYRSAYINLQTLATKWASPPPSAAKHKP